MMTSEILLGTLCQAFPPTTSDYRQIYKFWTIGIRRKIAEMEIVLGALELGR